eukprot:4400044-Amphidinium_carterae.1
MDTLGFEPTISRSRSGCDTTTPCAQLRIDTILCNSFAPNCKQESSSEYYKDTEKEAVGEKRPAAQQPQPAPVPLSVQPNAGCSSHSGCCAYSALWCHASAEAQVRDLLQGQTQARAA